MSKDDSSVPNNRYKCNNIDNVDNQRDYFTAEKNASANLRKGCN